MRRLLLAWLGLAACLPSLARAEEDRALAWQMGEARLELGGWIMTDLAVFPRTETGFGPSWNVEPSLRSARADARFRLTPAWRGRLYADFASLSLTEAWIEYRPFTFLGLRVGRIRVPFGLAQQSRLADRRLLETPMIAGNTKDFRDVGAALLGRLWRGRIAYSLAAVSGSRDLAVDVNEKPDLAARLVLHPLVGLGPWLEGASLGGSLSWGPGPTRNGFRGRNMSGYSFVEPPVIRGAQLRLGAELSYTAPIVRLAAEYQQVRQAREGLSDNQRIGGSLVAVSDLEPWEIRGFYAELAVQVFGLRDAHGPVEGLEIAGRFESIDFADGKRSVETAEGTEDHAPLADSWVEAWTAGLNYYFEIGLRLSAAWQAVRYGRAELAPDFDPDAGNDPAAAGHWTHHVFLRAAWVY
ncbi:MAG: hypothetical protein JXR96_15050 [Deltaproteobacteria bacterium]|nr:hypothetical protein [Deltaproteobacteria bacterium]